METHWRSAKKVLEGLDRQVPGVDVENFLVDKKVAPTIGPMIHSEYVDNFEAYAYKQQTFQDAAVGVESKLNDVGLPTHPVG